MCLHSQLTKKSEFEYLQKKTAMLTLYANTDLILGSTPPSPVDRRLSWGKLVQRLADFSSSMESNSGSRSDLSDSGKNKRRKTLSLALNTCTYNTVMVRALPRSLYFLSNYLCLACLYMQHLFSQTWATKWRSIIRFIQTKEKSKCLNVT